MAPSKRSLFITIPDEEIAEIAEGVAMDIVGDETMDDCDRENIANARRKEVNLTNRLRNLHAKNPDDIYLEAHIIDLRGKFAGAFIKSIIERLAVQAAQGKLPDLRRLADDLDEPGKWTNAKLLYESIEAMVSAPPGEISVNEDIRNKMRILIKDSADWKRATNSLMVMDEIQADEISKKAYERLRHTVLDRLPEITKGLKEAMNPIALGSRLDECSSILERVYPRLEEAENEGYADAGSLYDKIGKTVPVLRESADRFSKLVDSQDKGIADRLRNQVKRLEIWQKMYEERKKSSGRGPLFP